MKIVNKKELRLKLSILTDAEFDFVVNTAMAMESLNLRYCNGDVDSDQFDISLNNLKTELQKIKNLPPILIQHDPRGPALRFLFADKSSNTWGGEEHGYGILFDESEGAK